MSYRNRFRTEELIDGIFRDLLLFRVVKKVSASVVVRRSKMTRVSQASVLKCRKEQFPLLLKR